MGEATEADKAAARAWISRPRGHSDDQADAVLAFAAHRRAALIEGARLMQDDHPFIQALKLASELYTDAEFAVWLTAPQPLLDGWTPVQLLGCGKSDELLRVMQALDDGVYI